MCVINPQERTEAWNYAQVLSSGYYSSTLLTCFCDMQCNLSFGTPLYKGWHLHSGDKIWSWKNVHIMFVTSIKRTPLFGKKGHFFLVLKPGFNFHSGDTLWLKSSLVTMVTAFKTQTISLTSMYYTCGNSTHSISWPAPFYTSYFIGLF